MPLAFTFDEASTLLKQLKSEHVCKKAIDLEVTFSLKRTLGQTQQKRGSRRFLIRLSAYLSYDEMQDTMRHEFAHVMAGLRKAHGEPWKEWAVDVGATPKPCVPRYPALTPLHVYSCPNCKDHVIRRVNRLASGRKWVARQCGTPLDKFIYSYFEPTEVDVPPRIREWLSDGYIQTLALAGRVLHRPAAVYNAATSKKGVSYHDKAGAVCPE